MHRGASRKGPGGVRSEERGRIDGETVKWFDGVSLMVETRPMGRAFESITDQMKAFCDRQHMFFVATAPNEGGHVNLSPKGYDSFRILGENQVAYLDLMGSGAETIAHVRENGRITFMFCAFEGKPNIIRFYGTGKVVLPTDSDWEEWAPLFSGAVAEGAAVRSVIVADVHRTSNSCGYAVPFMDFVEERSRLIEYGENLSDDDIVEYQRQKNATSIDGLSAVVL